MAGVHCFAAPCHSTHGKGELMLLLHHVLQAASQGQLDARAVRDAVGTFRVARVLEQYYTSVSQYPVRVLQKDYDEGMECSLTRHAKQQ
jgi:hypothetical protein